jgi:hypothetical protein
MDAALRDYVINTLCILTLLLPFSYAVTRMLTFRHPWAIYSGIFLRRCWAAHSTGQHGLDGLDTYYTDYPHTRRYTGRVCKRQICSEGFAALLCWPLQCADMLGTAFLASLGTEITTAASSSLLANPGAYVLARAVTLLLAAIVLYPWWCSVEPAAQKKRFVGAIALFLFPISQALLVWFYLHMSTKPAAYRAIIIL